MSKALFCITLDDYAKPGFVSFSKKYYGTLDEIENFINLFKDDEDTQLKEAFEAYKNSNKNIETIVAYSRVKMLKKIKAIAEKEMFSDGFTWCHYNIWDCPYNMRCEALKSKHIWIKDGKEFHRIIKANFTNLQYEGVKGEWVKINSKWGYPHIIEGAAYNTLMVIEKSFSTIEEVTADIDHFNSTSDMDFTEFCNDIFGDG